MSLFEHENDMQIKKAQSHYKGELFSVPESVYKLPQRIVVLCSLMGLLLPNIMNLIHS